MTDISINGVTAASLSFYVDDTNQLRNIPVLRYAPADLYGRWGVLVAGEPSVPAVSLTLSGRIITSANTVAARVAAEHLLKDALVNTGLLTLGLDDGTTPALERDGYTTALDISPLGHPLLAVASQVRWTLWCPDPLWRATSSTTVTLASPATPYDAATGTAPSLPVITITGAATDPTVTVKDADGVTQVALAFTVSLTGSDTLVIDCATGLITKYATGTPSNGMAYLTSGTFPFSLDPAWADYGGSNWPTIEVSAGTASAVYTKRYL